MVHIKQIPLKKKVMTWKGYQKLNQEDEEEVQNIILQRRK